MKSCRSRARKAKFFEELPEQSQNKKKKYEELPENSHKLSEPRTNLPKAIRLCKANNRCNEFNGDVSSIAVPTNVMQLGDEKAINDFKIAKHYLNQLVRATAVLRPKTSQFL